MIWLLDAGAGYTIAMIVLSFAALPAQAGTAAAAGNGLFTAAAIAEVVVAAVLVLMLLAVALLLLQIRKLVRELGNKAGKQLAPLADRGKSVAANVEFISMAVRNDVEKLSGTIRTLKERLDDASDHMEERIQEFNALMEVVQGEAEHIFLDTAAVVEGVKAGARTLQEGDRRPRLPGGEGGARMEAAPRYAEEAEEGDDASRDAYVTGGRIPEPPREAGGAR